DRRLTRVSMRHLNAFASQNRARLAGPIRHSNWGDSNSMASGWRPTSQSARDSVERTPLGPAKARHDVATISVEACAHGVVILASDRREDAAFAWWACRDCGVEFAPIGGARALLSVGFDRPTGDGTADREYVSIRELSRLIPYAEGSIRNLM